MPSQPTPISKPILLLGEGADEVGFFEALLEHLQRADDIQVEDYSGKDKLSHFLGGIRSRSGFSTLKSLVITRDADASAEDAFKSVSKVLVNAGFPRPLRPAETTSQAPRIAVLILPNESDPGALESICLKSIRKNPHFQCVEQYFQCMEPVTQGWTVSPDKAKLRVWLTAFDPYARISRAAKHASFSWDDPAFQELREFFSQL